MAQWSVYAVDEPTHYGWTERAKKLTHQWHPNRGAGTCEKRNEVDVSGVDEEDVNVAPETIGNNFAFGVAQNTPQKAFDFGPGM